MIKSLFAIACFLYFSVDLFSQSMLGRVIDIETNQPIAYVHIYLHSGFGTISNENGDFVLNAQAESGDTLFISHIGYEPEMILLKTEWINEVIRLKPASTILNEVAVYDKEYTTQLIENVYQQLKRTNQPNYGKAFYRQVTFNNSEPTEIHEMFFNVSYSSTGIKKYSSSEARFAKKVSTIEKPLVSMTNQLYLTFGFDLLPNDQSNFKKPFISGFKEDIDFTITGQYSSKNDTYILISYQLKDLSNSKAMSGTITVNKKNNCICRYEAKTKNSLGVDSLKTMKLKKALVTNHMYSWDMGFDCQNEMSPTILYSITKASFDASYFGKIEVNSKLILYERLSKRPKKLKDYSINEEDLEVIAKTKYHAKFWEDNEILKRTPLEQEIVSSFEKAKSFGNYLVQKP